MSGLRLWAQRALTPERELQRVRVRVEAGRIAELADDVEPASDDTCYDGATLVPGLIDLQVNGGDGAAYDAPDADTRRRATRFHLRAGTTSLLATLVSAPLEHLESALGRLAADFDPAGPVLGTHLEGPFLSAAKAGAHSAGRLCDPEPPAVERLLAAAGRSLAMVTLAPERRGALDAVERFAGSGAVVAAGHSVATIRELRAAIERGLSFMTHVGNASDWPDRRFDPEVGYRRSEPGMVGTFLVEPRLRGSLILDGHHLDPELARAMVELRGPAAIALVSDATPAAGLAPGRYDLGGLLAEVHEGGFATAGEGLAGSVIPLLAAVRQAVAAGLELRSAVRMATLTPAEVLSIADRKGRLEPGFDADLLLLDAALQPLAVYRAGEKIVGEAP